MRRQANALQQLQAFIAGGGLIAFQHFHLRQRQVFDDRQVGKQLEVLEYHAHAGTQFRQIGFFVVHNNAVNGNFAFLHRFQTVDGLN
ncbi:Uncharacterised protein [Salmonella enterica subsp. enterica serovar Typhi]|nr:Uncharacterised protein [Salmonella enterica subsp. enterica serovar Typhi]